MVNDLVLNRLFTRGCFRNLIDGKGNKNLIIAASKNCGVEYEGKTYQEIIGELYTYISKEYRNEYFYKNVLLNKLVFGKYSPKTTTALTEITIGEAKADFILINGKAVVYEIKTELDNLERLSRQISEYYKAFRYVTVVTYPQNYKTVLQRIDNPNVGVCIINEYGRIDHNCGKQPSEYLSGLDIDVINQILRKKEFEQIIIDRIGRLPDCSSFEYYKECHAILKKSFSSLDLQKELEKKLKQRTRIDIENINEIPKELKQIVYFSDYRDKDYKRMKQFLNMPFDKPSKEVFGCIFQF